MPAPTAVWFHSLTESVYALGAAAREYRIADQAARIARWNTDPTRPEWAGSQRLANLRDEVLKRERAHAAVNGLDWPDGLVDDAAAEFDSSPPFATGLADSACTYGESAESALHFLLLAARTTHTPEEH